MGCSTSTAAPLVVASEKAPGGRPCSSDALGRGLPEVGDEVKESPSPSSSEAKSFGLRRSLSGQLHAHMVLVRLPSEDFAAEYDLGAALGSGGFGYTCRATHRPTGRLVAVKRIHDTRLAASPSDKETCRGGTTALEQLCEEIERLMELNHPHILRPLELWPPGENDAREVSFVMELCQGGELYARPRPYAEAVVGRVLSQVSCAVAYMHAHGVIHQDLKPQNVLWRTAAEDSDVVVIDFGISVFTKERDPTCVHEYGGVGTPNIMAPEFFLGRGLCAAVDAYALGCLTYLLLAAAWPFPPPYDDKKADFLRREGEDYAPLPGGVSRAAADFVTGLLLPDPQLRMTARDAADHPFTTTHSGNRPGSPTTTTRRQQQQQQQQQHKEGALGSEETTDPAGGNDPRAASKRRRRRSQTFASFAASSRLRQIALSVLAYSTDHDDPLVADLRRAFLALDGDRQGTIDAEALVAHLAGDFCSPRDCDNNDDDLAPREAALRQVVRDASVDSPTTHGAGLSYNNFIAATIDADGCLDEDAVCRPVFRRLDANASGKIEPEDLVPLIDPTLDDPVALIRPHDLDGDGALDFSEFTALLRLRPIPPSASDS